MPALLSDPGSGPSHSHAEQQPAQHAEAGCIDAPPLSVSIYMTRRCHLQGSREALSSLTHDRLRCDSLGTKRLDFSRLEAMATCGDLRQCRA